MSAAAPSHPLLEGMEADARFYFVHSYLMVPQDPADVGLAVPAADEAA